MADVELLIEIGMILLVAFIGATIATKLKQSAILGYIIAGALIGPYMYIELGPIVYTGVVHETGLIDLFSQLGIILLIFFVGLEFSIDKIKQGQGSGGGALADRRRAQPLHRIPARRLAGVGTGRFHIPGRGPVDELLRSGDEDP